MHRSRAPYRCGLFKTIYNCCETSFGRTQDCCTWLVFRTRASSDGIDNSDSGEWIHLKRRVVSWRVWPNRSTWTPHHALWWDGRLVESQEGLEAKVGPKIDLVERLFGNRALVWCLAGIDYDMPKFDSDDLFVGSRPCPSSPTVAPCVSLHSDVEAADVS
ncbi:hypothetical protein M9H77_21939 [Catharanthus roseus]|uniref:Uncharacterized protein n=1 Tax=Catharanthus roseus TaxID=4058 RepID=A0ACC0APS3_CATRO|nr:hypothetical protein M9H77_21939 [Catharanthus roseus]